MPYTAEQEREIKETFAARRRRQLMVSIPAVVFVLGIVLAGGRDNRDILGIPANVYGPAMLVLVVGVLIFSFRNWRCPACGGYLGRAISPRFCSKCGVTLQ